ncbi:MAG: protein kinase [Candidatus Melainabacteria bacterium]|nr:protein kinase [Candidatus Melainabacteria bacterium]
MSDLCKNCGKPPLAEKAGSFTSYLFVHNYCQCKTNQERSSSSRLAHLELDQTENLNVCGLCGKAMATEERSGSFTSFLFKDLRCQCKDPIVAKPIVAKPLVAKPLVAKAVTTKAEKRRTNTSFRSTHKSTFHDAIKTRPSGNAALKLGTIIGGTFKIQSIIGSGGMGVVYAAEHTGLRRAFALKILSPELVNEQTWKRFQAEAKTLGALHHSTLVNVYDLGIHDHSLPYYSMELLEGRTLEQILIDDGPLYLDEAIEIFLQVLEGLAYAHRNDIIHRDLKPGNIMICNVNGENMVKILDFGISKFLQLGRQNQSLTMAGETFGSPFYMSPEQSIGGDVDARSDIYSIGCSLFEALTAYVPFDGESQMEILMMHEQDQPPLLAEVDPKTKFPDSIEYVVAKCLEKHPDDRYQSAKELAIDLKRIKENKYARSFFDGKKPFKLLQQRRNEIGKKEAHPANSKRATIVFTSLLTLATVAIAATIVAYSRALTSIMPISKKEANKAESAPKFYSKLSEDGSTIEFEFPEYQIGEINTNRKTIGALPAQGKISYPADKRLFFFTNGYSAMHPEIIKSFRSDDLYSYIPRFRFESKEQLKETLINLKQLTGLKRLELAECEFGDSEVEDVNALSNLDYIDLKNTNLTPVGLKDFHLLKRLTHIYFDLNKYVPELLKTIAGNTQLKTLYLSTPDKPITSNDIEQILTLTSLVTLNLENTGTTDEMILQLAALPHLKYINARGCNVSRRTVEEVAQKSGNRITIAINPAELTKSIQNGATQEMPEFYEPK